MKKFLFALILTACCLLLFACSTEPDRHAEKQCRVVLSESPYYTCSENVKTVRRGDDADFTLLVDNGYEISDASYNDHSCEILSMNEYGQTTVTLTLKNVKYPVFVDLGVIEVPKTYNVAVESSSYFRCESAAQFVKDGENAVFTLFFDGEYTLDKVNIDGSAVGYYATGLDGSLDGNSERRVVLTVENVRSHTAIAVKEKKYIGNIELSPINGQAVVGYVLNGGRYLDKNNEGFYFTRNYRLEHFNRPNTSIGTDMICRDGFVLVGWNTERDGSGEHIGLGSRADVSRGETLLLYAEWAEWTDPDLFDYVVIDEEELSALYKEKKNKLGKLEELAKAAKSDNRCAVVTAYKGVDDKTLVVPETLGGYSVAATASRTIVGDKQVETVVFPSSMSYVMELSFIDCEKLTEIYLFDNMRNIDFNAFGSNPIIETLHINAVLPPIYGKHESAQLANKIEMLVDHGDSPKTVLFGSCSIWYSINAKMMGEATGRTVYNMGVEGDTCVLAQLDLIMQYMNEGDELVYLCDIGSPYLLGYDLSFDPRSFRMFESNYDLFATLNIRRYTTVFSALNEYFTAKRSLLSTGVNGSYDDYLSYMSEFGDMDKECVGNSNDGRYNIPKADTLMGNGVFQKTKAILKSFADAGIDVYYGFGLISEESLYTTSTAKSDVEELDALFINQFSAKDMPAKMVGRLLSSVLPAEYFYDQPYRLTTEGAKYYTEKFIEYFLEVADRRVVGRS